MKRITRLLALVLCLSVAAHSLTAGAATKDRKIFSDIPPSMHLAITFGLGVVVVGAGGISFNGVAVAELPVWFKCAQQVLGYAFTTGLWFNHRNMNFSDEATELVTSTPDIAKQTSNASSSRNRAMIGALVDDASAFVAAPEREPSAMLKAFFEKGHEVLIQSQLPDLSNEELAQALVLASEFTNKTEN